MNKLIRVTGRMKAFRKIPSGRLRPLEKVIEPIENGTIVVLETQSEIEELELETGKKVVKVVLVKRRGRRGSMPFYVREDEINAADHDQTLQRRYAQRGRLRTAS